MATVVARAVTVARADITVLDQIELVVSPGHRIGIVGPNGVGKTTLLRTLAGLVEIDGGTVERQPPTATVGYLPQEPERRPGETVRAFLGRRTGVSDAHDMLTAATERLADPDDRTAADDYDRALTLWLALGGADIDHRAEEVCEDVGLGADALDQPMLTLSGGEAARASLAAVLLARFDVFLLDEPTNDLDFAGLAQLERFVLGLDGAAVLVSHDRTFLDRTVTDVFELDEHSHRGRLFGGGWAAYLEDQAVARRHAEEAFAQFEGQRDNLVGTAQRTREWAAKGALKAQKRPKDNDKIGRKLNVESSEKLAGKASRAERALERLDVVDKPWEPWQLQLELKEAPRSGAIVARLRGAVIDRGEFHLGPIDLELAAGERLAVLGPNGSGKSTLISALLGQIDLTEGEQWVGPGAVIGIVDQRRTVLDEGGTVLEAFTAASGMLAVDARTLLAKFGLVGDHVRRSTATLSPGERTRALLALFMAKGTNCLVLDEPTNHLDLPAIEQLEQALETWTGTLVLVTHDRSFLEHVRIDRELRLS